MLKIDFIGEFDRDIVTRRGEDHLNCRISKEATTEENEDGSSHALSVPPNRKVSLNRANQLRPLPFTLSPRYHSLLLDYCHDEVLFPHCCLRLRSRCDRRAARASTGGVHHQCQVGTRSETVQGRPPKRRRGMPKRQRSVPVDLSRRDRNFEGCLPHRPSSPRTPSSRK